MTNTTTPPRRWSVRVTRYMNATDFDLYLGEECCGAFHTAEELMSFALVLQGDLDAGAAMTTETRESYEEIIAAIREAIEEAA